jgi:putative transposase
VKLRTRVTKGAGSKDAALAMTYKLVDAAQARWRVFNGAELVEELLDGATFKDGVKVTNDESTTTDERFAV